MNNGTQLAVQRAIDIAKGKASLARLVGVKPQTLQQWANGQRPIPTDRCVLIERVTNGAVTRRELRPDDWSAHWPELETTEQAAA